MFSQALVKTTRVTKTTEAQDSSSPVVPKTPYIEEIDDESDLIFLLGVITKYEDRQRIRARLRHLMAEREACTDVAASVKAELREKEQPLKVEEEEASDSSEYNEDLEEDPQIQAQITPSITAVTQTQIQTPVIQKTADAQKQLITMPMPLQRQIIVAPNNPHQVILSQAAAATNQPAQTQVTATIKTESGIQTVPIPAFTAQQPQVNGVVHDDSLQKIQPSTPAGPITATPVPAAPPQRQPAPQQTSIPPMSRRTLATQTTASLPQPNLPASLPENKPSQQSQGIVQSTPPQSQAQAFDQFQQVRPQQFQSAPSQQYITVQGSTAYMVPPPTIIHQQQPSQPPQAQPVQTQITTSNPNIIFQPPPQLQQVQIQMQPAIAVNLPPPVQPAVTTQEQITGTNGTDENRSSPIKQEIKSQSDNEDGPRKAPEEKSENDTQSGDSSSDTQQPVATSSVTVSISPPPTAQLTQQHQMQQISSIGTIQNVQIIHQQIAPSGREFRAIPPQAVGQPQLIGPPGTPQKVLMTTSQGQQMNVIQVPRPMQHQIIMNHPTTSGIQTNAPPNAVINQSGPSVHQQHPVQLIPSQQHQTIDNPKMRGEECSN